jgi:hypothetical protein
MRRLGQLHRSLAVGFPPSMPGAICLIGLFIRARFTLFVTVALFHGEVSGDPSPVRARPLSARSLNSPSQRKPRFSQRFPDGFAGETVPAIFPAQTPKMAGPSRSLCAAPFFAIGLRPPAPMRGVADESLTRLRDPSCPFTKHANKLTRFVLPPPTQKIGSHRSASKGTRGGFGAGCSEKALLAVARPRSARGQEGEGKGVYFPPPNPRTSVPMWPRIEAMRSSQSESGDFSLSPPLRCQ